MKKFTVPFLLSFLFLLFPVHLLSARSTGSKTTEDFGDALYRNREYDLARLEYERILHQSGKKSGGRDKLQAKLALSLMHQFKYRQSIGVLEEGTIFSLRYLHLFACLKSGFIHAVLLDQGMIREEPRFSDVMKQQSDLLAGTVLLERGRYDEADRYYRALHEQGASDSIRLLAGNVSTAIHDFQATTKKSPLLAGIFSALLPGGGQFYSDHEADAVSAFAYNALFIGSAATIYNLERRAGIRPGASIFFGLVGLFFYATNITGAIVSAKRYNIYRERNFQQEIRDRFFNLDYVEQTSGISFQKDLD